MTVKKLKTIILSSIIISTIHISYGQNMLHGLVKDNDSGKPVEFAQVALMQLPDSTLQTGGLTGMDGKFSITTPLEGEHLVRISFIGYNAVYQPISITKGTNNLGSIALWPSATELDEVRVTAAAALFRSEADRRIYNVENMTIAEGGTAMQVLETLPSVQVDEEGNVSMLGSGNILIYINGRPTNLSSDDNESILEQFPANAIKDVELITNPSARFDAEGVGGIINLVLREQRMLGFNGQFNLSSGTGNKYTGGANLNYRHNRWNMFTSYSFQYRELWEENISFRERFTGTSSPFLDQDYFTENFNQSHLLRFGAEFELNSNSSVRAHSTVNARSRNRERVYNIRNLSTPLMLDSMYVRLLEEDQSRVNYELSAGYNWNNGNGQSLSANATASWDSQDRIEYFNQQFLDANMLEVSEKLQDQFYERPLSSRMMVFELDYKQNILESLQIETGLKSTLRYDDRSQNFGQLNLQSSVYEEVVLSGIPINNRFTRDEDVHAGYLIVRNNNQRFSYMAGLRTEYTNLKTYQQYGLRSGFLNDENFTPAIDTTANSNYFGLFPSIFLSYEIAPNNDVQISYSRRIRRPRIGAMLPFINAQDFFNLRLGNPFLEPAFTNSYEMNYIRSWEKYMVTGGVFHRNTTNGITRLFVPFEYGTMVTWTNASTANSTGVELINYFNFNSNFDVTLSGNYYHSIVSGELEGNAYSNESYSWTASLMGNLNIPKWFRAQLSANYWGPRVIPQGQIKPVFSMNIGLRRNVLNNNGTLSLNVSDVLNTRKFSLETTSESFYQRRDFIRESRVITLSFTWRFRNFREQNDRMSNGGIEGDIDGLF